MGDPESRLRKFTFDSIPGVKGVCKDILFTSILLYFHSLQFDMQYDHIPKDFLLNKFGRKSERWQRSGIDTIKHHT